MKVGIPLEVREFEHRVAITPDIVKKVVSLGKEAVLVECNVLYKGSRTCSTDHLATAKEHGFDGMTIDILDGENGEEFLEIDGCKIEGCENCRAGHFFREAVRQDLHKFT